MRAHRAILVVGLPFLLSVEAIAQVPAEPPPARSMPNILVIVADDIGVDILSVYDEGYEKACNSYLLENHDQCYGSDDCPFGQACVPNYPPTPTIDSLAANGILFRNAWSCPTCSPTRATIQTGRYGFRTGVLFAGGPGGIGGGDPNLPGYEITIPEAFALAGSQYADVALGKWHLGGGVTGPNDQGYSDFYGTEENFWLVTSSSFFVWPRIVNGVQATCYNYATSQNVDDALAWIGKQSGPWFMYLAFNAAHIPVHAPPDDLHSYHGVDRPDLPWVMDLPPLHSRNCPLAAGTRDYRYCYLADVEAMDREMGRLRAGLTPQQLDNTIIIFVGDNGTSGKFTPGCDVIAPPFDPWHGKGRLYEGGINVPLIICGARVQNAGRESTALVNTTDLFATILNLAGVDPEEVITDRPIDSVSLMPIIEDSASGSLRDYVYSEQYLEILQVPVGYEQSIRNVAGYKLIHRPYKLVNRYELYYLPGDPWEDYDLYNDLLPDLTWEQQVNFDDLKAQLEELVTTSPPDGQSCQPVAGALEWPVDPEAEGYRVQLGTEYGTGTEHDVDDAHFDYYGLDTDMTYWWRVRPEYGFGIYGPYSRCYSFITAPDALPPPMLLLPANGASDQHSVGILDWSDVPGALGYRVQIGMAYGTGPEYDVTGSQYAYSELEADETHFWRVKTKDACDQYGDYSACFSFDVAPEPDINCEDLDGHYFGWTEPDNCGSVQTWEIVNEGGAPLQGQVVKSGGDCGHFTVTQGLGEFGPLAPGESSPVEVEFCPTSVGRKACVLQITSNDPYEDPCEVLLTGDCGIGLWGDCTDGDVTLDPSDPYVCDPELSEPDACVLMREMQFCNLFVPAGIKLDTHAYTVRVCETLVNYGEITDSWSGGPGGAGGAGGVGRNGKGAPNDPTGCDREHSYCTGGGNGVDGDAPLVWQPEGKGHGGRGGGGGGGGGAGWHGLTINDADGGNGGTGGMGGKGGGYVKVYARRLDNHNRIHADGHPGGDGADAPPGDEGDEDNPHGYEECGAEYWPFIYLILLRDVAGGGGGGGGGGQGGHGGTLEVRYAELLHGGSMTWAGGPGGPGGDGGSGGGCCIRNSITGGCSDGCDGGIGTGGDDGLGGSGGHGCNSGGEGSCGECGEAGATGTGGPIGTLGRGVISEEPECQTAGDCDDGLYCNGVEQCAGGQCMPGIPPTCGDGLDCTTDWCSDVSRGCQHDVKSGHCLIDGSCHVAGTVNPANECEECNPLLSTLAWSPRSAGVQCGDWESSLCDEPDTCDGAGHCQPNHLPDGSPCDDGLFCSGTETCVSGECQPGEPPIPEPGDISGDGSIDLEDHAALIEALAGPGLLPTVSVPDCLEWYLVAYDLDEDGDVDLADFAFFQQLFTGTP